MRGSPIVAGACLSDDDRHVKDGGGNSSKNDCYQPASESATRNMRQADSIDFSGISRGKRAYAVHREDA